MRRGGVGSKKASGATTVAVVIACCLAVGLSVGAAARLSASRGSGKPAPAAQPAVNTRTQRAALAASLDFVPAPGATSVAPDAPIVVTAVRGHLTSVQVTSPSGDKIGGTFTPASDRWASSGSLGYDTEYRVTAKVAGTSHARAESTMSFRTLTPAAAVTATIFPSDRLTVGVGQPIVIRFSRPITSGASRGRLLAHLSVTESQPILGGWYWFSDTELHFRPAHFWPSGEHVTFAWDLTGWNAAGAWGAGAGLIGFNVGDAHVSFADLTTDVMTVTDNGTAIATYPISGGKPTDPTMNGIHVVLDRSSVVHMVSSTNGIPVNSADGYDELVYDDVHISDSGEYVHAAPWSVGSQGHTNVSHGCINLSPENALAFFAFSRVGDVVVVAGSSRPPALGDHGVMDWDTHWSAFMPAPVVLRAPSGLG